MSISSEITSMGENLKKDYQAIANLGADLTNVDKNIENIAELLDGVYDNLPKTDYSEGSNITLSNTLKGKLDFEDGIVGYGQTEQETTQGYNLLQNKAQTLTHRGVTYTINSDGSVKVNGKATGGTSFCVLTNNTNNIDGYSTTPLFHIDSAYYCTPQNDLSSVYMMYRGTDGSYYTYSNVGNHDIGLVYLAIDNGVTIDNLTVFPMVTNGSNAKNWEKFTFGASPNPSYPQDIEVVRGNVEARIRGINLNEYNINSATNKFQSIINLKNSITFKANNTYTLAFDTPNTGIVVYHQALDGITWDKYSVTLNGTRRFFTFTIGDNDITTVSNWGIILRITDTSEISTGLVTNVMLYEGEYDSSIPYEPYQTPQTYQLSLGDYEFAKIGNYVDTIEYDVDEDKVYKNEKITKRVFNGTEQYWNAQRGTSPYIYSYPLNNYMRTNELICICNYFKAVTNGTYGPMTDNEVKFRYYTDTTNDLYFCIASITSLADFKTWLSTHNVEIRYVLNTPTKIEITGTLKDQIKALYYSHSFTGTTIIEINGQLPLIIKVRALKGE